MENQTKLIWKRIPAIYLFHYLISHLPQLSQFLKGKSRECSGRCVVNEPIRCAAIPLQLAKLRTGSICQEVRVKHNVMWLSDTLLESCSITCHHYLTLGVGILLELNLTSRRVVVTLLLPKAYDKSNRCGCQRRQAVPSNPTKRCLIFGVGYLELVPHQGSASVSHSRESSRSSFPAEHLG